MQAIFGDDDAARPASKRAGLEHLQVCALHPLHQVTLPDQPLLAPCVHRVAVESLFLLNNNAPARARPLTPGPSPARPPPPTVGLAPLRPPLPPRPSL